MFQTANALATMRIHENKVDTFITQWNNDPANRSKIGQLRQSLEETKDVLVDDLEEVTKRGQTLSKTAEKSQALQEASVSMNKRSKEVKRTMCCRKYMYYIIGVLVTIGLGFLLYFLLR